MVVDIDDTVIRRSGADQREFRFNRLPPSPPTAVAVIESIATGTPELAVDQLAAADRIAALFGDPEQRERIPRVYRKTKIDSRRMAVDLFDPEFDAMRQDSATIRDRMTMFYQHAAPLAVEVAGRAVAGAACAPADIGLLVFVTSTGFVAPGVDVAIVKELGLSPSIARVVVNFMGCAAAVNGMRIAADYVRAYPDMKAMVVCIELPSVNAVFADNLNDVVIHSLFGDGCGAVVVGASGVQQPLAPGRVVIRDIFSRLLDDAEDGIVLGVNHNGVTCELAESLPDYIYGGVDSVITDVLADNELGKDDIDLWAIHPGGPKIIEESVRSLAIPAERAALSWDVLARFGNMLSVSLIFVLEQMARSARVDKAVATGVAFAFGPGVTVEGMVFDLLGR
jgi:alpha-pyrone synthase